MTLGTQRIAIFIPSLNGGGAERVMVTLANAMAKKGRTECLVALQTSSSLLADRITYAYTKDKGMAGYAPTAVYIIKMGELCRPYINRERAAYGLGPM